MNLLPDTEQSALVDAIRDFLRREMPLDRLRPRPGSMDLPAWPNNWKQFAELGWFGLGLAEEQGGVGYGVIEEMLAFREFGRFLLSPSMLATVMAAHLLAEAGARAELARVLSGDAPVCLAMPFSVLRASEANCHLIDANGAKLALVCGGEQMSLHDIKSFAVLGEVLSMDNSVTLARATQSAAATPLASVSSGRECLRANVLVSALQAGIAEAARDAAVDYAKVREQFGQPIGAFQAIKHKCADMAVSAEAAVAQTAVAAIALANNASDAEFQVAAARIVANRAAIDNGEENIQVHGGIGFTVECDAHLYVKRAHLNEHLFGRSKAARERLLALQAA